jgi:uncharacterized membrane protein HdeD (DUF308 family)
MRSSPTDVVPGTVSGSQHATPAVPRWAYVVFVVRGAVALALGLSLLAAGANLSRLVTFVAIYWIVAAVLTLHWVAVHRVLPHRRVAFAAGLAGLVVGLAVAFRNLFQTLLSEGAFLDFLGLTAIAIGGLRLMGTIHDDQLSRDGSRRRYRFVLGTLEVVLGIALLTAEQAATDEIRLALALWALATGTFLLLDALTLRSLTRNQTKHTT